MRPLTVLDNSEKAKILFELFPDEVPAALDFIRRIAEVICHDPSELRNKWENHFVSPDWWLRLARDINKLLEHSADRLAKNSRLFSQELFDDHHALFSIHCLQQYIQHDECENMGFRLAVEMLFN